MKSKLHPCLPGLSLAVATLLAQVSCTTDGGLAPFGQQAAGLARMGLLYASATGQVRPGDVITIGQGLAVITTAGGWETKVLPLAELGLGEAVSRGALKPGDAFLIKEGLAVFAPPAPAADGLTGSK